MLLRKPSLTVTGALAPVLEFAVELEDEDEGEDEEQPARSRAAPIIAAVVTRRI
jgi:hypothetical protein